MTGRDAIAKAEGGEVVSFVYRAEGRRTEGVLADRLRRAAGPLTPVQAGTAPAMGWL